MLAGRVFSGNGSLGSTDYADHSMGQFPSLDGSLRTKALLFLHVHKTAGTTLHRIIEREYNPFHIYTIEGARIEWSVDHLKKLPLRRRAALQVVKGHMSFGLHEQLPQPSTYITFLRDPVERCISSYYYSKGNRFNRFYKRIAAENLDLPAFLDIAPWNNNLQCKTIAGIDRREFRPVELFRQMIQPGSGTVDPTLDRWSNVETLERAKENLTRYFGFVGLTERFSDSLVLLKHLFGWKVSSYSSYRKSRNRPKTAALDPRILAIVEERNQFDRTLYEFGKKMFEAMIEQAPADIDSETAAFRAGDSSNGFASARALSSAAWRAAASRLVSLL
jgi:Sulfotransferase family